jgi:hypothetical protein
MQTVLVDAIDQYRRRKFLKEANAAFAALQKDTEAWADEQPEREIGDRTAADGLEHE